MKTLKCYHHLVINSFSQRNMAIKICSRMKTWHKAAQSYIILLKDWGGVGRQGLKGGRGKFFACRKKKTVSKINFPLMYRTSSN